MKALFAALLLAAATQPALAAPPRPAGDLARDAARHPMDMLVAGHIGQGDKVVDFIPGGGYFTRIFAAAVGPSGHVTAVIPAAAEKLGPADAKTVRDIAADPGYGNVSVAASPIELAPASQDVFWTAQNYHDLHNAPDGTAMQVAKVALMVLKPGGAFVIVDHAAAAGSGFADTGTLHRIDPEAVKAEVVAAGFVFDGESKVLANPADDHSKMVFDPAIRGKTDQFVFRFRKP